MPRQVSRSILSIGYEGRSLDDFVRLLKSHDIAAVFDVRELPLSRRRGFSKTALRTRLEGESIEYVHLKIAGNPFRKQKADVQLCLSLYGKYLTSSPEVVQRTAEELKTRARVAILCYERDHDHCHRSILLSAVKKSFRVGRLTRVD